MPGAAKWWTCFPRLPQKHWTILIVDPCGEMIDVKKKPELLTIALYKIPFHLSFTIQKPSRLVLFKDYLHLNCEDIVEYLYLWLRLKAKVISGLIFFKTVFPKATQSIEYVKILRGNFSTKGILGSQQCKREKSIYFLLGWSQKYIPVE